MHNRIRTHVTGLLSAAPDCPEKNEITEEMIQNLIDKYDDLIAQDRDPEDAYREVIAGIGDVSEIVAFIRGVSSSRESAADAPFAGFEERARDWSSQLSHDIRRSIEDPLRDMAKTLDRDIAHGVKEPLRGMSESLKSAMQQVKASVRQSGRGYRYDYTFDSDGINALLFEMQFGDLTIRLSDGPHIRVSEFSRVELSDDQCASFDRKGDCLRVTQGRSYSGGFLFGTGVLRTDLEVELPRRVWHSLTVTGVADFEAEDLQCQSIAIKSNAGDIALYRVESESAVISSASGDVEMSGRAGSLEVRANSGDIDLRHLTVDTLKVNSIAGDFHFSGTLGEAQIKSTSGDNVILVDTMPRALSIRSISGDTRLDLPENDGFSVEYKKISGDLKSDFNLMASLNSRKGTAIYKNGCQPPYEISSTSGDIRITRARWNPHHSENS